MLINNVHWVFCSNEDNIVSGCMIYYDGSVNLNVNTMVHTNYCETLINC